MRNTLWAAAALAASSLVSFRSTYEPDLWWHLAQGRETAAGHLLRTNLFSAGFAGYRQHYTSWLFDLGSYLLWTQAGAAAIQAMQALLLTGTLLTVAAACRVRSSTAASVMVCALGWVVLEPRALPRPYLVSFVGMALCAWLIERARAAHSSRPLWWALPVVALWANVHVECVFGVALIGLFAVAEWISPRHLDRRHAVRAIAIAATALGATLLTPYGIGILKYLSENTFVPQVIDIAEVHPAYLPNYRGFFVWGALTAASMLWRWREVTLTQLATVSLFATLGARYLRLTPLLFLVSAPLVAHALDRAVATPGRRRALAVAATMFAILLVRVPLPTLLRNVQLGGDALEPSSLFSPGAMRFARERGLAGPAFTSINLGGYVAWYLYPSTRVFVDARLQSYPPEFFRSIAEASSDARAWAELTSRVDWAVVSLPRLNPWSGTGRFDPSDWGSVYQDAAIEILVRRNGRYAALITSF